MASGRRALRRANQHELAKGLGGDVTSIIAQFFFYYYLRALPSVPSFLKLQKETRGAH